MIAVCSNGDIQLAGGNDSQGRVEFCNDRVWGTVCDDQWDTTDAQVVCRQLGFPIQGTYHLVIKCPVYYEFSLVTFNCTGATALRGAAQFGPGVGRVWLSQVNCSLNDTSLANCSYGVAIGSNFCGHNRDAGVICFTEFGNCYWRGN